MQIQESTDYALRLLVCLAGTGGPVTLQELASETNILPETIPHIAAKLRHAGYIQAAQREEDTYDLSIDPSEKTLYDVICTMEEGVEANCIDAYGSERPLPDRGSGFYDDIYGSTKDLMEAALVEITIGDLARKIGKRR